MIYFAHSMFTYGSQIEKHSILFLQELGLEVFNPATQVDQTLSSEEAMARCFEHIEQDCIGLAALINPYDGPYFASKGVWREMNLAKSNDMPVALLIPIPTPKGMRLYMRLWDGEGEINDPEDWGGKYALIQ